jgi:hypothetical protein
VRGTDRLPSAWTDGVSRAALTVVGVNDLRLSSPAKEGRHQKGTEAVKEGGDMAMVPIVAVAVVLPHPAAAASKGGAVNELQSR